MAKKKLNLEDATEESNEILTEENPVKAAFSPDEALVLNEGITTAAEDVAPASFPQSILDNSMPQKKRNWFLR